MFYTENTPADRLPMLRQHVLRHGYAPCFVQPAFPLGWAYDARQVLKEYAQPPAGADLRMMQDHRVMEHLPWLHHWYCEVAPLYAKIAFSLRLAFPASISLALIQGENIPERILGPLYTTGRLGITGILFLETLHQSNGGHLVLSAHGKQEVTIPPQEGLFVLFPRDVQVIVSFTRILPDFSLSLAVLDYYYEREREDVAS